LVLFIAAIGGGVLWNYHDEPEFCTTCHIMDPYLESWASPPLLANAHAEYDLSCLDCHPFQIMESAREVIVYVLGNYEDPLREREFSQEWCFQCHEHGSYEELKGRTAEMLETVDRNPHDSHLGELRCSICHKMHRLSDDFCAQCHGEISLEARWAAQP